MGQSKVPSMKRRSANHRAEGVNVERAERKGEEESR